MYYEVVITTKDGQYTAVFRDYNDVEEFVRTVVLHSREPNINVIVTARRDETWETIMQKLKKDEGE